MSLINKLTFLRKASHQHPSEAEVRQALDLVSSGSPFDELFFSEISDPAWLMDLERAEFFSHIPPPIRHDDGSISYPRMLSLLGLTRLAPMRPSDAARIIADLPPSENLNVGDQIMRCMLEIKDPTQVSTLLPVAQRLVGTRSRSSRLFLRDLLKGWMLMGHQQESLKLMETFIESLVRVETEQRQNRQVSWELEECDRDILKPLVSQDPIAVAKLCFAALQTIYTESNARNVPSKNAVDDWLEESVDDELPLTYWLKDFKQSGLRRGDPSAILAHRLYVALGPIYSGPPGGSEEFDEQLRIHPWELFKRLRWQLYADHPKDTLKFARRDTLELLPHMGRSDRRHGFEFASMLESQSETHRFEFLSPVEISSMISIIKDGPIDNPPQETPTIEYQRFFWHRQLWPIREILPLETRSQVDQWTESQSNRGRKTELEDYKPFRSYGSGGFVQDQSPCTPDQLEAKSNDELWEVLNTWEPTSRWIEHEDLTEETHRKLARAFVDLIAKQPERFSADTRWWEYLRRPVMLSVPLGRWAELLNPKENSASRQAAGSVDLASAFALADYIVTKSQDVEHDEAASEDSLTNPDWRQARLAIAHFLDAYLGSDCRSSEWSTQIKELLLYLTRGPEWRLDCLGQSEHLDWQFEAINSVRGAAWDAVLKLALSEKNQPESGAGVVPEWIPSLLTERLNPATNESPATFSLLGSNLRMLAYLLPDWLHAHSNLLFPADRLGCSEAALNGHFSYDQPYRAIIETIPHLHSLGLDSLERRAASAENSEEAGEKTRDFSSRLGFHIAFYAWNDWFPEPDQAGQLLDRFFSLASPSARAESLSYIGSVFEKVEAKEEVQALVKRTQGILDDRLKSIREALLSDASQLASYEAELGQLADLVAAECFPFEWRVETAAASLELIDQPRWSFQLIETVEDWAKNEERVPAGIRLLHALTKNLSDELRWSIQIKRLMPMLEKGRSSSITAVRNQTNELIENLLHHKFFELLDLDEAGNS